MSLAIIIVLLLVFLPNIPPAIFTARTARYTPSNAWQSSLSWMRENTPDPFGNDEFYYKRYEPPPPGQSYNYPASAYGVVSWWDYGYWITRIAHRPPSTNPGQAPGPIITVANLFLSQGAPPAQEIMQKLDASYVILDYDTTTSKIWAVITWSGKDLSEFFDVYHVPLQDRVLTVQLYYPEYYRSLCVRLYNFDGQAVTASNPLVITYREKTDPGGAPYKEVTNAREFPTYEEALAYVESQNSDKVRIVGTNPFISPVPLEALTDYKLVHSSAEGILQVNAGMVPEVKIFEYTGKD